MDALKRAEHAKQQGQADAASAVNAPDLAVEPMTQPGPSSNPPRATLPELPKLEDLDPEFIAHARRSSGQSVPVATSRPGSASTIDTAAGRDAIKNAFAVKTGNGENKNYILLAVAVGLLSVGVAGAYFWLQLKPAQKLTGIAPAATNDIGARPDVIAPPPASGEIRFAPKAASAVVVPEVNTYVLPPTTERRPRNRGPVERAPRLSTLADGDTPIRVTTSHPGVDPSVAEGYQRLQAGDPEAARAAYIRALWMDPRNADALHGMAAIALRQGKTDEAAAAYQRILDANPGDAAAEAALVGLSAQGDPVADESRLKSLLSSQGDQPAVYFALANLYARQGRWNEAQQANFKAVGADASNPDYLFNLAVSLDQLHQPKLAAQYYGQAITAAENRSAAFDRAQAARRMRELQR
jgi:Tfp pilus assembly protein PilF